MAGERAVMLLLVMLFAAHAAARQCSMTEGVRFGVGDRQARFRVGKWGRDSESSEACRDLCDKEAACRSYKFGTSAKKCYLMSVVSTEDEKEDSDWTSGECEASAAIAITKPADCWEAKLGRIKNHQGNTGSGTYTIYPVGGSSSGLTVACNQELDGGGWTYLMNRVDATYFGHGIYYYKHGFGSRTPWSSHWLGLEWMHQITRAPTALRVQIGGMLNWRGRTLHGVYRRFSIGSESQGYPLNVHDFNDFGLGNGMWYHHGRGFVTRDWGHGWRWCSQVQGYNWWWWAWYGQTSDEAPGFWFGWCWWVNPTAKWRHVWNYWFGFSSWSGWWYTFWGNYHRWPWYYGHRMDQILFMAKPTEAFQGVSFQKLLTAPTRIQQGKLLTPGSQLVSTGAYTWMMYLRMEEISWHWKNIIHKGHYWWERNVAFWNYPGTTRLYVSTGLAWWWWWGFLSNTGLKLFKWTHIAFYHSFDGVRLFIDGKLDSDIRFGWSWAFAMANKQGLYLGTYYCAPMIGQVAQIDYKPSVALTFSRQRAEVRSMSGMTRPKTKITWTNLLSTETKPKGGKKITNPATTNKLQAYTWTFWIKVLSTSHRGPAVILRRGSGTAENSIHVQLESKSSRLTIRSSMAGAPWGFRVYELSLPVNQWMHVAFTHRWGEMRVYQNGVLLGGSTSFSIDKPLHNNGPMYLGASSSSGAADADALVTDVWFANEIPSNKRLMKRLAATVKKFYADQETLRIAQKKARDAEEAAKAAAAAQARRERKEKERTAKAYEVAQKAAERATKERKKKEKQRKEEQKKKDDADEKYKKKVAKMNLLDQIEAILKWAKSESQRKWAKIRVAKLRAREKVMKEADRKSRQKMKDNINRKASKKVTSKASKNTQTKYAKKKDPKKLKKSSSGQSSNSMKKAPSKKSVAKQAKASKTKKPPPRPTPKPPKTSLKLKKKPKRKIVIRASAPKPARKLSDMTRAPPLRPVKITAKGKRRKVPKPKLLVSKAKLANLANRYKAHAEKLAQKAKQNATLWRKMKKFWRKYKNPPKTLKKFAAKFRRFAGQKKQKGYGREGRERIRYVVKKGKDDGLVNMKLLHKLQAMSSAAHAQGAGAVGGQVSGKGPQFIYNIMGRAALRRAGGRGCDEESMGFC